MEKKKHREGETSQEREKRERRGRREAKREVEDKEGEIPCGQDGEKGRDFL